MQDTSPEPDPAAPAPTRDVWRHAIIGLVVGASALVAFTVQWFLGVQVGLVILAINLGLAAGAYGLVLLLEPWLREAGDAGVLQFMGFVAIALLGRVWLGQTAQGFAILFEYSLSLGALAVAAASILFRMLCAKSSPRQAALINSVVGATLFSVLVGALLATSPTRTEEKLFLLGLTCVIVPVFLGVQWSVARRTKVDWAQAWAAPIALALVASQLFDGVLTYLVLGDPLGIAPGGYEEQIPLSRFILDNFGIGFPIAKWILGLVVASALVRVRFRLAADRTALVLAVLAAGMGPSLYTASQLF